MDLKRMNGLLEAVKSQMVEAGPDQSVQKYERAHKQYTDAWKVIQDALSQMQSSAQELGGGKNRELVFALKSYRKDLRPMLFPKSPY